MKNYRSKRSRIDDQRRHLYPRRPPGRAAAGVPRKMTTAEAEGEITLGLIAMRKAGLLRAVHIHASRIQLELVEAPGQLRAVSWELAATMVDRFLNPC